MLSAVAQLNVTACTEAAARVTIKFAFEPAFIVKSAILNAGIKFNVAVPVVVPATAFTRAESVMVKFLPPPEI